MNQEDKKARKRRLYKGLDIGIDIEKISIRMNNDITQLSLSEL